MKSRKPVKRSRKCTRGRRKSDGKCKRKPGPKRKSRKPIKKSRKYTRNLHKSVGKYKRKSVPKRKSRKPVKKSRKKSFKFDSDDEIANATDFWDSDEEPDEEPDPPAAPMHVVLYPGDDGYVNNNNGIDDEVELGDLNQGGVQVGQDFDLEGMFADFEAAEGQ